MGHYPSMPLAPRSSSRSWSLLAVPVAIAALVGATALLIDDEPVDADPTPAMVVDFEIEQTLTELQGPNAGRALSGLSRSEVVVGAGENVVVGSESTCLDDGPALVSDVTATMIDDDLMAVEAIMKLSVDCEPDAHADETDLADGVTTLRISEMVDLSDGDAPDLTFEVNDGIDRGTVTLTVADSFPASEQV